MTDKNEDRGDSEDPLSELYDALSHPYRRRILVAVDKTNPQQEDDLVSNGVGGGDKDPERAKLELTHTHLPKLDEAGLIIWNRNSGIIIRGPRFEEIEATNLINEHPDELPDDRP